MASSGAICYLGIANLGTVVTMGENAGWTIDDRALLEISSVPFEQLLSRATEKDLLAINHLYRVYTKSILKRKAMRACSHLSHMGNKCQSTESDIEHAYDAALQHGIERVFGYRSKSDQTDLSISLKDQFDAKDLANLQSQRSSVLNQINKELSDKKNTSRYSSVELWGMLVSQFLKTGFVDESRRKWNMSRGLVARIDQSAYFFKKSSSTAVNSEFTEFFNRFCENWTSTTRAVEVAVTEGRGTPEAVALMKLLSIIACDFLDPRDLLKFLRVLYWDACENTLQDRHPVDTERLYRSLCTFDFLPAIGREEVPHESTGYLATVVEACLARSYPEGTPEDKQAISNNLRRARDASRILSNLSWTDSEYLFDKQGEMDYVDTGDDSEATY